MVYGDAGVNVVSNFFGGIGMPFGLVLDGA
jgi:hypothetical protein